MSESDWNGLIAADLLSCGSYYIKYGEHTLGAAGVNVAAQASRLELRRDEFTPVRHTLVGASELRIALDGLAVGSPVLKLCDQAIAVNLTSCRQGYWSDGSVLLMTPENIHAGHVWRLENARLARPPALKRASDGVWHAEIELTVTADFDNPNWWSRWTPGVADYADFPEAQPLANRRDFTLRLLNGMNALLVADSGDAVTLGAFDASRTHTYALFEDRCVYRLGRMERQTYRCVGRARNSDAIAMLNHLEVLANALSGGEFYCQNGLDEVRQVVAVGRGEVRQTAHSGNLLQQAELSFTLVF